MRLLHTRTLVLRQFMDEAKRPSYAILSHTWGKREVSFQEMMDFANKIDIDEEKEGFQKIKAACNKAHDDTFFWIWIDTCCIDKSSSAELSEAINSLYHWYQSAGKRYAYLADVPSLEASNLDVLQIRLVKSHWFARGWTLQELIASARVEFLSADWSYIATKSNENDGHVQFCHLLSKITGVDIDVLRGIKPLATLEIAVRMSWASKRETTRPEDMAYCLLGLFDVSIRLLYGEGGKKAFIRLQEELMRNSDDQSLFVWTQKTENPPIRGPLADSPAEFASAQDIKSFPNWTRSLPYSMTNLGLQVSLPVIPFESLSSAASSRYPTTHIGVLNCIRGVHRKERLAIELCRLTPRGDQYARVNVKRLQAYTKVVQSDDIKTIYIRKQILEADTSLEDAYVIEIAKIPEGFKVKSSWPQDEWDPNEHSVRLRNWKIPGIIGALLIGDSKTSFVVLFGPCDGERLYHEYCSIQVTNESSFSKYCKTWESRLLDKTSLDVFSSHSDLLIKAHKKIIKTTAHVSPFEHLGRRAYRVVVTVTRR
ncbi:MAG: hypothetical protein M1822_009008 [Bathelium mastoideum]|nr:MAG: hypothetical protein M1822_009008 [Bathelium mastoideum]